jgi:DNA modification methylase
VIDTRVIYCGDDLDQLRKLPDGCVDLIYIDPPFNSNRNYEVFCGRNAASKTGTSQGLHRLHAPRCVELARVLKETGSYLNRRSYSRESLTSNAPYSFAVRS